MHRLEVLVSYLATYNHLTHESLGFKGLSFYVKIKNMSKYVEICWKIYVEKLDVYGGITRIKGEI